MLAGRAGSGLHASSSASSSNSRQLFGRRKPQRVHRQSPLVRAAADEQLQAPPSTADLATAPQPPATAAEPPSRFAAQIAERQGGQKVGKKQQQSSWNAKEANGGRGGGADYLFELGMGDTNTNVDAGQNVSMIDYLFTGNVLGHKTDIADGTLRNYEMRSLAHLSDGYYIAPTFMDKVTMHIIKNFLVDAGSIPDSVRVPLILGIWGHKGTGKSFQTELVFKKLGLEPIIMSAGELESEVAGRPGRLIRERYRKAADMSRVNGKLSCLLINDLDAGIARFGNTQVTVNNQIVVGTLMNICDHPNKVSVYDMWREEDRNRRIPIIVTGNDFSRCYAPLVRDGRMEKFFWEPTRTDLQEIVHQMYKEDNVTKADIAKLLDHFGGQGLDFFGALRSSTYDGQIRDWVKSVALERPDKDLNDDDANMAEVGRRLLRRDGLPVFEPVDITLDMMIAEGERLQAEQQLVMDNKLSKDYYKVLKKEKKGMPSLIGLSG